MTALDATPSWNDWIQRYGSLEATERETLLQSLEPKYRNALTRELYDWSHWARPEQLEPEGDWFIWLIHAGRGFGKTRTGAETVRRRIDSGAWRVVNAAGPTWMDVYDYMVHGTDQAPGLMRVWPPEQAPKLHQGENPHLVCHNGAIVRLRAAKEAERFRGPQADGGWCDELDSWDPNRITPSEAFALFELGIRLGDDPRIIATTTPKRGRLVSSLRHRPDVHVTRGSTYDNRANLGKRFLASMEAQYQGTRLGRQELLGEVLDEVEGAIVTHDMIDASRVTQAPELERIVVGVDPSGGGDAQGIVVAGRGVDGKAYILADRTCCLGPDGWGRRAVAAYHDFEADRIVAERNYGGDMVAYTLETVDRDVSVRVVTASRGKHVRFEPIGGLYEQGRVCHVGTMEDLEDEVCGFTPDGYDGDESPNRADALVWALDELMLQRGVSPGDLYGGED